MEDYEVILSGEAQKVLLQQGKRKALEDILHNKAVKSIKTPLKENVAADAEVISLIEFKSFDIINAINLIANGITILRELYNLQKFLTDSDAEIKIRTNSGKVYSLKDTPYADLEPLLKEGK